MYAPLIAGDVTVTVTGEIASALIQSAGLGEARDDCWRLRDGTTTTLAESALTDALVAIAEDPIQAPPRQSAARHADHASRGARRGAKWIIRRIRRLTGLSREVIEADAKAEAETTNTLIHAGDEQISPRDQGSAQAAPSISGSCWPLRRVTGLEIQELLQKGTDSTDPAIRLRCGVILAVNAGASPTYLAMARRTTVEHITRVISDFNDRGLPSVEDAQ
jgi:hypothetical protein